MIRFPLLAAATLATAVSAAAQDATFAALGDAPYGDPVEVYASFEALISTINAQGPALVIHVGYTKSGDNEWTDCHGANAGGFDPLDRLADIRAADFAEPGTSFGAAPAVLAHQGDAGFPENARMTMNDVMFMTAYVVGSNNNFETRDMLAVEEFMASDAANLSWLEASFAAASAETARALVLAINADMSEFDWNEFGDEGWLRHSGFQNFGPALVAEAATFGAPVLLIYGGSHVFRQHSPSPDRAPNLLALEVPGASRMPAVKVGVSLDMPGISSVSLLENPALAN